MEGVGGQGSDRGGGGGGKEEAGEARRWRCEDLQYAQELQAGCSGTTDDDAKCGGGGRGRVGGQGSDREGGGGGKEEAGEARR